jgi:Mg2+-importing ATPase
MVLVGIVLPYSPLAGVLGFVPLPAAYFLYLSVATLAYLLLVEVAKRYLLSSARGYRHRLPIAPVAR